MAEDGGRPDVWLVRHGETEWSLSGQHTGRSDIPLTDAGRAQGTALGEELAGHDFGLVLTSPRQRARETARLAGFGDRAVVDADLAEWDYGEFEGLTTPEIRDRVPGWRIWDGPWPGGETCQQIGQRADRVISRLRAAEGDVLVFSHGHVLRVLAARWIGLSPADGGHLALSVATISVLGWERTEPAIERWNEACHLPV
ncbi:MAG: histidine phosphatase family protein [Chloroflexota bacterium]